MKNNVLITGGNGFIGSHIIERFLSGGINVSCLVRKESNLRNIESFDTNIHYGDIRDKNSIKNSLNNIDYVIHNASYVKDWGNWKTFYDINVQGTLNVLETCHEAGINNIIITGSISSYGEEHCFDLKDENSPYNSHLPYFMDKIFPCKMNYYRDSKRIATQNAIEFAKKNKINLTIIEPVWVYGEREFSSGFYEYLESVKDGMKFMPGSKKNKFHVVYAKDLANAYFLLYKKKMTGIHRFIIGNNKAENMDKIYTLFCESAGLNKPKNIPKWVIYPIGFLWELLYTILRSKKPPLLTRGRINMFYDNIEFSTKKAHEILEFNPQYSLEDGIKNTINWYKDNGYL